MSKLQTPTIIIVFTLTSLCACDERDEYPPAATGQTDNVVVSEFTTFDVTYNPDAVVHDDLDAVQSALVNLDYTSGLLTVDSSYSGLDELSIGKTALIAGVGIIRIKSVEETSRNVKLSFEAAPITDIIESGHIAWRRNFMNLDNCKPIGIDTNETDKSTIQSVKRSLTGSYEDGHLSFSGKLGIFDTAFDIQRQNSDLKMSLSATYSENENTMAKAFATGVLNAFSNETEIIIEDHTVTDFSFLIDNLRGEISIDAGAVALGDGEIQLSIPAGVSIPIVIGGIPFHIDLGGGINFASTLQSSNYAILKGVSSFSGSTGIQVKNGTIYRIGEMRVSRLEVEQSEQFGLTTAGFRVIIDFPKVGIGVGWDGVLSAKSYMKLSTEIITNMTVSTLLNPQTCIEAAVNLGAYYGGSYEFLGFAFPVEESVIFGIPGEDRRSGDSCESMTD
jgi:hypothetical protein